MGTVKRVDALADGYTFTEDHVLARSAPLADPDTAVFRMWDGDTVVEFGATVGTLVYDAEAETVTIPLSYTVTEGELDLRATAWRQRWVIDWTDESTVPVPDEGDCNWVVIYRTPVPATP